MAVKRDASLLSACSSKMTKYSRAEAPIMLPVNYHYTTGSRYGTISIPSSRQRNCISSQKYQDVLVSFTVLSLVHQNGQISY